MEWYLAPWPACEAVAYSYPYTALVIFSIDSVAQVTRHPAQLVLGHCTDEHLYSTVTQYYTVLHGGDLPL